MKLLTGNSRDKLKELEDDSIDALVTDPPYLINFMGKDWDKENSPAGDSSFWEEVLRVMKPGAHGLVFGHSRQHHRVMTALEDAGFEIRDCLMWLYGSGFPKSHNISKAIDKHGPSCSLEIGEIKDKMIECFNKSGLTKRKLNKRCGFTAANYFRKTSNKPDPWISTLPTLEKWNKMVEVMGNGSELNEVFASFSREVVGTKISGCFSDEERHTIGASKAKEVEVSCSTEEQSKKWEGWGTALKPAYEPIILVRKPLEKKLTVAKNVLKHGTGGINIDASRIGTDEDFSSVKPRKMMSNQGSVKTDDHDHTAADTWQQAKDKLQNLGRFPANVLLAHHPDCKQVGEREEITKNHNAPKGTFAGGEEGRGSETIYREQKNIIPVYDCADDCAVKILDEQSGTSKSSKRGNKYNKKTENREGYTPVKSDYREDNTYSDKGGASRFFKCVDACPVKILDEQAPKTGNGHAPKTKVTGYGKNYGGTTTYEGAGKRLDGLGGASRFFYCAKVGKKERNAGLDNFEEKEVCYGYKTDSEAVKNREKKGTEKRRET
jgi:hypothetical protein